MYAPVLRAHAMDPKNRGRVDNANAFGESSYPPCGDLFKLSLRVEDGRIAEAGFETQGCGPLIALGSLATEAIRGLTVEEALSRDGFYWDKAAGGLPAAKRHAILLFLDSLHQALTAQPKLGGT
jgi:NifU-like protein involved in Fe-S cluster formation